MLIPDSRLLPFPWRDHNRFQLLIDGDRFYPAMLDAIATARSHILLEMYLMESGDIATRFIDALSAAAARGVAVYLLLDDFGARGLHNHDKQRLEQCAIKVSYYNRIHYNDVRPNFFRDHRKALVVDGHIAFVGGTGITDEFSAACQPELYWRETVVAVEGAVIKDWQALFNNTWRSVTGTSASLPAAPHPAVTGAQRGRISYTHGIFYSELNHTIISRIRSAHNRAWITTAYFVPSIKLRRALRQAARRDVDVRLLLPGEHTDHPAVRHAGRRFYHRLLRHGVRIFEYQPRFTHSKVVMCDDWVSIGSSNLDRWTSRWNLDANQEIDDPGFAAEVRAMFEKDFTESNECLFGEWRQRPWYRRLPEDFWGRVDLLINYIFHHPFPRARRSKDHPKK